jgi:C_GCAxxG_C_C family probable redox protein
MNDFSQSAADLFMEGNSCSESVVRAACKGGLCGGNLSEDAINSITSAFSGAMGTHECLCGAVAGSQIVLGLTFGRTSFRDDPHKIKGIAAEFVKRFKEKRHATCCKVLRAKYKDDPVAGRQNCAAIVSECAEILSDLINEKMNLVTK